jgi:hypothetical protein
MSVFELPAAEDELPELLLLLLPPDEPHAATPSEAATASRAAPMRISFCFLFMVRMLDGRGLGRVSNPVTGLWKPAPALSRRSSSRTCSLTVIPTLLVAFVAITQLTIWRGISRGVVRL